MDMLPREFSREFKQGLLEVHWRHWTALGVPSNTSPETNWLLDLEATVASTLAVGLQDKRLLSVCLEWLIENGEWVNFSRLKKIAKVFTKPLPGMDISLLTPDHLTLLADTLRRFGRKTFSLKKSNLQQAKGPLFKEYKRILSTFHARGVVTEPRIQQSSLFQLLLRSIFGVDARSEVFIYLLTSESGNSNSIGKAMFCEQKSVYRILEKWKKAGVVEKDNRHYFLRRKEEWLRTLGIESSPNYVNWVKSFLVFDCVGRAFSSEAYHDDKYLLASLFRDLLDDVRTIARTLDIEIPEPALFPGELYFDPFATAILKMLHRLNGESSDAKDNLV